MNKITGTVTAEQLKPCQVTYEGNKYSPITHKEIIETLGEHLYKNNFTIKSEKYLAASNGQMAIGRVQLAYPDSEIGYEISWKNALNGMMSFGICSGSYTFICSNGSVYGDITSYKSKHFGERNLEMLQQIEYACNRMEETMKLHIQRRDRMKEIEMNKRQISEIAGRLHIEQDIITTTQLGILKKEIENPSFNYKSPGSLWEFYSNCTCSTREANPLTWHKTHKKLGDFFVNEFNLLETNNIVVPEFELV